MTSDDRFTWGFVLDVFDVLESHGYHQYDNQHTGRAFGMIFDLAHVYEGAREARPGPVAPSPHPERASPGRGADQGAIILTPAEVSAVFAAADIAADDKRYRVEMCPDCPDQSCSACQIHLRDAEAFDRIADRMLQAARTGPPLTTATPSHPVSPGPPLTRRPASDQTRQDTPRTRTAPATRPPPHP